LTVVPSGISGGAVCLTDVASFYKNSIVFFVMYGKLDVLRKILPVDYLLINCRECLVLINKRIMQEPYDFMPLLRSLPLIIII
jgi:hypothetical protein